jgi:hypothetical protein
MQDVGEAHHDRRGEIARLQSFDDFEQIDVALRRAVGPHHDVPASLIPKYGLPHAVTWYRSSESSMSQAGLGVNLFAGWSKVGCVLVCASSARER